MDEAESPVSPGNEIEGAAFSEMVLVICPIEPLLEIFSVCKELSFAQRAAPYLLPAVIRVGFPLGSALLSYKSLNDNTLFISYRNNNNNRSSSSSCCCTSLIVVVVVVVEVVVVQDVVVVVQDVVVVVVVA